MNSLQKLLMQKIPKRVKGAPPSILVMDGIIISARDLLEQAHLRLKDRLGLLDAKSYMGLACQYSGKTVEQALEIAIHGKESYIKQWFCKERKTEKDYISFYSETDFYIFRQPWKYRTSTWHYLAILAGKGGKILDYGCGAGCASRWIATRYPNIEVHMADIPSASWDFIKWCTKHLLNVKLLPEIGPGEEGIPLVEKYDVIFCHDVMEHLPHPLVVAKRFIQHLRTGGYLVIDYYVSPGGPHLQVAVTERTKVLQLLSSSLIPLVPIINNNLSLYRKPKFGSSAEKF